MQMHTTGLGRGLVATDHLQALTLRTRAETEVRAVLHAGVSCVRIRSIVRARTYQKTTQVHYAVKGPLALLMTPGHPRVPGPQVQGRGTPTAPR